MTEVEKKTLLIFIALAALATALLASSLPQMELKPGWPLPVMKNDELVVSPTSLIPVVQLKIGAFFRIVLFCLIMALGLNIGIRVFKGTSWKRLVPFFLSFVLANLLLLGILAVLIGLLPASPELTVLLPEATSEAEITATLGSPPLLLKWAVGIGIAITVTIIGFSIFNQSAQSNTRLSPIELEAEKARTDLLAGIGLKDVVLRCYKHMSLALQEEHGIERQFFMTTGEFENLLTAKGFPYDSVHQLTQLFEAVRYGRWQPGKNDEQKAIDCLTAIIKHSQERM